MATSALLMNLFLSHPFLYSPVTLQKSCSSFLRLSVQPQSLLSKSWLHSFTHNLCGSNCPVPPQNSCTFCLFFADRSPGLLFTALQFSFHPHSPNSSNLGERSLIFFPSFTSLGTLPELGLPPLLLHLLSQFSFRVILPTSAFPFNLILRTILSF